MYHEHEARVWAPDVTPLRRIAAADVELVVGALVMLAVSLGLHDGTVSAAAFPLGIEAGPLLVVAAAAATLPKARLGLWRGEQTIKFDATGIVLLLAAVMLRPEWLPLVALASSLSASRWRVMLNTCVRTIALTTTAIAFQSLHQAYGALITHQQQWDDVARASALVAAGTTLVLVEALLYRRHLSAVDDISDDLPGLVRLAVYRDAPAVALGSVAAVLLTVSPASLLLLVPLVGLVVKSVNDHERLLESTRDHKTGLLTLSGFKPQARAEIARARRVQSSVVVLMVDLDGLKAVNTMLGFLAGESVIRRMGGVLRETARESDLVARFGGDEFGLLLPDTSVRGGRAFAERLRQSVADARFVDGQPAHETTASIGMAVLTASDDVDEIIGRADRALRQAKASGKNQVVVMGPYPVQDDDEQALDGLASEA
jgi:diguanylate cyclase (GGDEF)-like protein